MPRNPLHDVAIVGICNSKQARILEGETSETIILEAIRGVLAETGLAPHEVDGIAVGGHGYTSNWIYQLGCGPAWRSPRSDGIPGVLEAAAAIATGQCHTALVAAGSAGIYTERESTAPWTRPANEFVVPWGLFTAAEFALIARRHMHTYGTTPEQLATVAATIRNNGHVNPDAIYFGRGPFTVDDILGSRMVADPFHLLDCAMTSEGASAMILTTTERARDLDTKPVWILGGAGDAFGPSYQHPPAFDLHGERLGADYSNGRAGKHAAETAFRQCGLVPTDVDVCEFYDPFSFEIIRQFEAYGFCEPGEGGEFVMGGTIEVGGRYPVTTDGGLMAFSHGGATVQLLQRVVRAVMQLRGSCPTQQVEGATVAMCSNGGAGALFTDVMLLGSEPA
jgi:acetyl-CoA acetyltransferase